MDPSYPLRQTSCYRQAAGLMSKGASLSIALRGHMDRLRHARRRSHGLRRAHAAVHLQPNGRAAGVAVPVDPQAWHAVMRVTRG